MHGRLPFDPSKMRGPKKGAAPKADDRPLTVSQLAAKIEGAVKRAFPERLRVSAEVSSVTHRTHYYFTLKDEHASIGAVLFASGAKRTRLVPTHGDQVLASGRLDFYAPSGRLSFIVETLEPTGKGELERRLRERVDTLRERGWLDDSLKRPLPVFPRRIGVITSATGAALQDIIATAARRCPGVAIAPIDVRVQGERATREVARAVRFVGRHHERLGIDAIILTRGGGSLEDLWSFNETEVARAIHECAVPVVAAIGHETDTTIAELVADARASTPTQAAMMLVPDRDALAEQLDALGRRVAREVRVAMAARREQVERLATRGPLSDPARLVTPAAARLDPLAARLASSARTRLDRAARRLDRLALELSRHQPAAVHARRREHLGGLDHRLRRAMRHALGVRRGALTAIGRELDAISPLAVLERGYSVTTDDAGAVVRAPSDVAPGDALVTRLRDGTVRSTVSDADDAAPAPVPKRAPRSNPKTKPKPKARDDADQPDLF